MNEIIAVGFGVAIVVGALGWIVGSKVTRDRFEGALKEAVRSLTSGVLPSPAKPDTELQPLTSALSEGWVPRGSEREPAMHDALERVVDYLRQEVERPLSAHLDGTHGDLRTGAEEALGALQDLEFFTAAPSGKKETVDLSRLVREVIEEYSGDAGVRVRYRPPRRPIRVVVNPDGLKDALFLILHNAGQFGDGKAVEVVARVEEGTARLHVRDRGPGFTAEALSRAYDPFYTTLPGGLGLGLTHAKRTVDEMGGKIHLRNRDDGGGEIEIAMEMA
jgi:signal transduction histidine kinase